MKKVLPLLAVLLALVAVIAFTRRRAGGLGEKFSADRAAELAPAESVMFLQLPDLERTRNRWQRNEFGALGNALKGAAENWREKLGTGLKRALLDSAVLGPSEGADELVEIFSILAETETVDPAGGFLAMTSQDKAPLPKVIAGLPLRAKRTEVETAVRGAKERLFKRWAGAKSELSTHRGIEVETITSATDIYSLSPPISGSLFPIRVNSRARTTIRNGSSTGVVWTRDDGTTVGVSSPSTLAAPATPAASITPSAGPRPAVHLAFRDDWLFFATDRALLEGTLDRYLRLPEARRSLAEDAVFAECRKHGTVDADAIAWARWEPFGKGVAEQLLHTSFPSEAVAGDPLQAVLYSCTLTGPQSRDRVYFHLTKTPSAPALANRSIALTTPQTQGYAALNFDGLHGEGDWIRQQVWSWVRWSRHDFMLHWTKAELEEMWAAFGPEVGIALQRSEDEVWPEWVVALEVRDAVKARRLAERIAEEQHASAPTVEGGATRWAWPSSPRHTFLSPMVLTKTHLLFGTSRTAAMGMVKDAAAGGKTLQSDPAIAAALNAAAAPNGMLVYFDTPGYFAHSRGRVGMALQTALDPTAGAWGYPRSRMRSVETGTPDTGPPDPGTVLANAFGPQLRPGTVTLRTEGPGWLAESTLGVLGNTVLLLWMREP